MDIPLFSIREHPSLDLAKSPLNERRDVCTEVRTVLLFHSVRQLSARIEVAPHRRSEQNQQLQYPPASHVPQTEGKQRCAIGSQHPEVQ